MALLCLELACSSWKMQNPIWLIITEGGESGLTLCCLCTRGTSEEAVRVCLTSTIQAACRPSRQGCMQQRDAKARAAEAKGSTLENGADCSRLGLAVMVAFAFCTQLGGQLVPAGYRQKEVGPGLAPGVSTGRKTPCFCHFASLVIAWTVPLDRGRGVGLYQAGMNAQQPTWLPRSTGVLWPPSSPRTPLCLSVSAHSTRPALQYPAIFSLCYFGRWVIEVLSFWSCSLTCAFLLPWVAVARLVPGLVAQANLTMGCCTSQ